MQRYRVAVSLSSFPAIHAALQSRVEGQCLLRVISAESRFNPQPSTLNPALLRQLTVTTRTHTHTHTHTHTRARTHTHTHTHTWAQDDNGVHGHSEAGALLGQGHQHQLQRGHRWGNDRARVGSAPRASTQAPPRLPPGTNSEKSHFL
jgi:hypothetical protein